MFWLRSAGIALISVLAAVAMGAPGAAHEEKTGDITFVHPWSRPAPQGQNGVIYLEIHNGGAVDDRLIGVSMPLADEGRAAPEHHGGRHPPHGEGGEHRGTGGRHGRARARRPITSC